MGSRRASQALVFPGGHGLCSTIPVTPLSPAGVLGAGARSGVSDGVTGRAGVLLPARTEAVPAGVPPPAAFAAPVVDVVAAPAPDGSDGSDGPAVSGTATSPPEVGGEPSSTLVSWPLLQPNPLTASASTVATIITAAA